MIKLQLIINSCIYLVISSATILLNKYLYTFLNFPNVTLTFLHFLTAFFGLQLCEKCNVFGVKSVHLELILVPAILFCIFVTFMNLSLAENSLASYHVSKTIVTPAIILAQSILRRKRYSILVYFTLILTILGAVIVIQNDSHCNTDGTSYMIAGVSLTVIYELVLKYKQSELQMSKLQLLYYFAPISSFALGLCLPGIESPTTTFAQNWTTPEIVLIILSCFVVFLNNLVTYWIIANSTFFLCNMLIQIKLSLILYGSWYIFDESLQSNQLIGFALNITGCVMHQFIKMRQFKVYRQYRRII